MFVQVGSTSTVSPDSNTPLTLELVPAATWASTAMKSGNAGPTVMRPMFSAVASGNQIAPSGPDVMP